MPTTTNLGLTLPTVGADDDTWGTISNTLDIGVDAVFAAAGSGTSVGLKVGSGKTLNALDGTVVLGDAGLTIKDTADPTKIAAFQCSGITAGQTRTYTLPDASGTLLYSGGALGTPASGTLTSCTGLPISTGVSGLGTGVATLLGGASSGTGGPAGTASPIFSGDPSIGNSTTGGRLILNGPASTSNNSYINFSYGGTAKAYIGLNSGLLGNASNDLLVYSVADSVKVYAAAGLVGTFTSTGINSTAIGATTPGTGAFTTLSSTDNITFTKSVNGELLLTGTNSNAGTGASTITRLSNGTTWAELSHNGTGYTTSGFYRQDGTYLYGNGAGGITLVTGANQPIYFAVAGSAVGQVTATGINSTNIGATTPGTGAFTTLSSSSTTALKGTTTNDSASAGNIGEYVTATVLTGSAVSLTTATAADITSISLTAGDWDVEGCVVASPAGGTTLARIEGWTSSTSATQPTIPNNGGFAKLVTTFTAADQALPVGRQRFSLSGTTTVYLSIYTAFIGSTCAAYGFISARRAR